MFSIYQMNINLTISLIINLAFIVYRSSKTLIKHLCIIAFWIFRKQKKNPKPIQTLLIDVLASFAKCPKKKKKR